MLNDNKVKEDRNQVKGFTFFKSYYESSLDLATDEERLSLYTAIFEYAFNGKTTNISGPARAVFLMAKPVIDTSIKKALAGAKGGKSKNNNAGSKTEANGKQNGSKTEANGKQNKSDKDIGEGKESGEEKESREGKEYESMFEVFWEAFPRKIGKLQAKKEYIKALGNGIDAQVIIDAVKKQKNSEEWNKENGKYVPSPTRWLLEGRWDDVLGGNSDAGNDWENNDRFENTVLSEIFKEERSGKNRLGEMSAG